MSLFKYARTGFAFMISASPASSSPSEPFNSPVATIALDIIESDLFLGKFFAFLSKDGWSSINSLLLQGLLQLLVLKSVHLLDPVLSLSALLREPQIQLAFQLYRLLFLQFALTNLSIVLLKLCDDFLLFEF